MRTARSLALMFLAPPMLIVLGAHLLPRMGFWGDMLVLALAGAVGLAGVATAPWPPLARAITALLYVGAILFVLPFIGLLAACSTGNCL